LKPSRSDGRNILGDDREGVLASLQRRNGLTVANAASGETR
jgi:hypothetical protein